MAGCPLLPMEASAIAKRFDAYSENYVNYKLYTSFARNQDEPCATHSRLICAKCITYGKRQRTDRIICKRFRPTKTSKTMCVCGAYVSSHEMMPKTVMQKRSPSKGVISGKRMKKIFSLKRMPDTDLPHALMFSKWTDSMKKESTAAISSCSTVRSEVRHFLHILKAYPAYFYGTKYQSYPKKYYLCLSRM